MKTYLQLVNGVLRKLRESEVSTILESAYSTLIGDFVNDAKQEVEAAWKWTALRSTITIATVNAQSGYTVTGSGQRFRVLSIFDTVNKNFIHQVDSQIMKRWIAQGTAGKAHYYYWEGVDSAGDMKINFFPIPNAAENIDYHLVVPQADFTLEGTKLTIPYKPVLLRAYALAMDERGDDAGAGQDKADGAYANALQDAISLDQELSGDTVDNWDIYRGPGSTDTGRGVFSIG